jgi:hypothetical protein
VALQEKSVAAFYQETMDALRSLDVELSIRTMPVEIAEAIPFDQDEVHATYDPGHARAFWTALTQAHRRLASFAARFVGKARLQMRLIESRSLLLEDVETDEPQQLLPGVPERSRGPTDEQT